MTEKEMKSAIVDILKEQGLDIAEDVVALTIKAVLKGLPKILEQTENKYDDLLIPLLKVIEGPLLELVDKIDGEVG